jgi:CBS domain containing-hemolysin-like protein
MQLGRIPVPGELVRHHDLVVQVDVVRRRRIARLRVSKIAGTAADSERAAE